MHTSFTSTSTILMTVAAVIPVTQARYLWHPNEQPLKEVNHIVNRGFQNADPTTKAEDPTSKKDTTPTETATKADPKPSASSKPTSKESKAPSTKAAASTQTAAASSKESHASSSSGGSSSPTNSFTSALQPTSSSASSSSVISPTSSTAADSSGGGVSSGAVAGIVIAVLAVVGAIAAFVMVRRKKQTRRSPNPDPFTMGFGSHDPAPSSNYNSTGATGNVMAQPYHYQEQQQPQPVHMPPISPTYSTPPPPISPLSDVPPYQQQQYYAATAPVSEKTAAPAIATGLGEAALMATNEHHDPQVQQAGQPQDIPQGSLGVFNVVSTYSPTLSDEIDIQLGDRIEILVEYDDGWCQGVNLTRGNAKGVFPRHCVEQHPGAQEQPKNDGPPQLELGSLKRVSSMYMAYN